MTPAEFKEMRQKLGLTPAQAAPLLGYGSVSRISEIENGKRQAGSAVVLLMLAYWAGYRPHDWP
jgi:transcriptional regulator with XRE-family HTH domain